MIIFKKDFNKFFEPQDLSFCKITPYLKSIELKATNRNYGVRYLKIKNLLYNIKFLFEFNSTAFLYSAFGFEVYL